MIAHMKALFLAVPMSFYTRFYHFWPRNYDQNTVRVFKKDDNFLTKCSSVWAISSKREEIKLCLRAPYNGQKKGFQMSLY